jgi:hypothetical protein
MATCSADLCISLLKPRAAGRSVRVENKSRVGVVSKHSAGLQDTSLVQQKSGRQFAPYAHFDLSPIGLLCWVQILDWKSQMLSICRRDQWMHLSGLWRETPKRSWPRSVGSESMGLTGWTSELWRWTAVAETKVLTWTMHFSMQSQESWIAMNLKAVYRSRSSSFAAPGNLQG